MAINKPKDPLTDAQIRKNKHINPGYAFSRSTVVCPKCHKEVVMAFYKPGSMMDEACGSVGEDKKGVLSRARYLMCSSCDWCAPFAFDQGPVINKSDVIH